VSLDGRHAAWTERLDEPLLVRVGEDADLDWAPGLAPRLALLETCLAARQSVEENCWYALRTPAGGALRRLRWEAPRLTLLGQMSLLGRGHLEEIQVEGGRLDRLLIGRLIWAGPSLQRGFNPDQTGWPRAAW